MNVGSAINAGGSARAVHARRRKLEMVPINLTTVVQGTRGTGIRQQPQLSAPVMEMVLWGIAVVDRSTLGRMKARYFRLIRSNFGLTLTGQDAECARSLGPLNLEIPFFVAVLVAFLCTNPVSPGIAAAK